MQATVAERFKDHVQSVERLMNFDRDVLDFAISALENLRERLRAQGIDYPKQTAETPYLHFGEFD